MSAIEKLSFFFSLLLLCNQSYAQQQISVKDIFEKGSITITLSKDTGTLIIFNRQDISTDIFLKIGTKEISNYHSVDVFRNESGLNYEVSLKTEGKLQRNGPLVSPKERNGLLDLQSFKLEILPGKQQKLFIAINNFNLKPDNRQIHLYTSAAYEEMSKKDFSKTQPSLYISLLFLGSLLIMILFSFLIYLQNKSIDFLYYSSYLLFILFFSVVADFPVKYNNLFIWNSPKVSIYSKECFVYGYLICYHLFLIHFLSLRRYIYVVFKGLTILNYIFATLLIINLTILFIASLEVQNLLYKLNTIILFTVIPYYAYIIYRLFKMRHINYYKYILWGILFFYLGNITGTLSQVLDWNVIGLFPNNYTQIGTFIELCFFSLGLGGKMIEESRQKIKFQKQVLEVQMMALQTQMNPHFTFNCLNAIRNLVLTEQTEKASKYLLKFSKLLRLTLENSIHKEVTLQDNISYLEMYMSMERLRFGDSLSFNLNLHLIQRSSAILIPPMLVQPFIENAVKHAFNLEIAYKCITVTFTESKEWLNIIVEDNGIGINRKDKYNKEEHASRATMIINNYVVQWNMLYKKKIELYIQDKSLLNPSERGTIVNIKLKLGT